MNYVPTIHNVEPPEGPHSNRAQPAEILRALEAIRYGHRKLSDIEGRLGAPWSSEALGDVCREVGHLVRKVETICRLKGVPVYAIQRCRKWAD